MAGLVSIGFQCHSHQLKKRLINEFVYLPINYFRSCSEAQKSNHSFPQFMFLIFFLILPTSTILIVFAFCIFSSTFIDFAQQTTGFQVTAKLKSRMMNSGTLMISYQPLGDKPNFFRNIISNSGVQRKDVDFLLAELERLGHDL